MDLLVLFTGLIGAKSATKAIKTEILEAKRGDDAEVLAMKALLRNVQPFNEKVEGVLYEGQVDLAGLTDRDRDLAGQLLRRNSASGMVLAAPGREDAFLLRHGMIERLEEQLDRAQGGGSAPQRPAESPWLLQGLPSAHSRKPAGLVEQLGLAGGGNRGSTLGRDLRRSAVGSAGSSRFREADAPGYSHRPVPEPRPAPIATAPRGQASAGIGPFGATAPESPPREASPWAEREEVEIVPTDSVGAVPEPAAAPARDVPADAAQEEDLDLLYRMFQEIEPGRTGPERSAEG
jgi:hypothetical protein